MSKENWRCFELVAVAFFAAAAGVVDIAEVPGAAAGVVGPPALGAVVVVAAVAAAAAHSGFYGSGW